MSFLILKAYLKLIYFDSYLARGNFAALYDKVRNYPVEIDRRLPARRTHLFGGRHGMYLVLERSAVPAALGSDELASSRDTEYSHKW